MRTVTCLLLLLTSTLLGAAGMSSKPPAKLLLGSWQWTREANGCTEIYSFERDGVLATVSGAELTSQLFVVLAPGEAGQRLKLGIVTLADNGLGDCAEVAVDDTGLSYEIWVEFSPRGDQMLMCYTESGPECFGPLARQHGI